MLVIPRVGQHRLPRGVRAGRARLAGLVLASVALVAAPATAAAQAGWYLIPSVRLGESFDDNIDGAATDPRADFISQVSSALTAGYRSTPLRLLGTSDFTYEVFANNPDRNGFNLTHTAVDFQYLFDRRATLRLNGAFTMTEIPGQLTPELALDQGRSTSTSASSAATLNYHFAPRLTGEAGYSVTRLESRNITTFAHEGHLRLAGEATRVDTVSGTYSLRYTDSGQQTATSHVVTGGWTRRLSATWTAAVEAGPVFTDGEVGAEARAELTHRLRNGDWAITYVRTQTAIAGQQGLVDTQSLTSRLSVRPYRSLLLNLTSITTEATSGTTTTRGNAVDASATYRLTKYINAVARYRFSLQQSGGQDVVRDVISLELEVGYPIRLY